MKAKLPLISLIFIGFLIAGCSSSGVKTLPPPAVTITRTTLQPPSNSSSITPAGGLGQAKNAVQAQPDPTLPSVQAASPSPTSVAPSETPAQPQIPTLTPAQAESPSPASPAPSATPAQPLTPTITATPTAQPVLQSTTTSGSEQAAANAPACEDQAAFYADVTIPDNTVFRQQVNFVKTWQIKNTGTCTWGPDYALVFAGGDIMNGPQSVPLPKVNPGDLFNISVNLTSPANGGVYVGDWQFQRPDGTRFGVNSDGVDMIWVKIVDSYIVLGPTATPNPISATCSGQTNPDYINQVLALINNARSSNGLKSLTLNAKLSAAAQAHSNDMACNDFIDHVGSDGSTWFTRVKAQGYSYSYASENIYVGNPAFGGDAQGAFTWWMNSQVHRDNILSPKITEIGIGYTFYDKSTYGGYYTVDFAHP